MIERYRPSFKLIGLTVVIAGAFVAGIYSSDQKNESSGKMSAVHTGRIKSVPRKQVDSYSKPTAASSSDAGFPENSWERAVPKVPIPEVADDGKEGVTVNPYQELKESMLDVDPVQYAESRVQRRSDYLDFVTSVSASRSEQLEESSSSNKDIEASNNPYQFMQDAKSGIASTTSFAEFSDTWSRYDRYIENVEKSQIP